MSFESDIQEIKVNFSKVSNFLEKLNTIFLDGGVQNPDLAVMKGELQTYASDASNINTGILTRANGGTGVAATSLQNLRETINAGTYLNSGIVDFNTYLKFGVYGFGSDTTLSNCPNGINGVLMVFPSGGNVQQFWRRKGTININDKELWYRQISPDYATDNFIGTWRYFLHNEMLGNDIVTINGSNEVINGSKIFKNICVFERRSTNRSYSIRLVNPLNTAGFTLSDFVGHNACIGWFAPENVDSSDYIPTLALTNERKYIDNAKKSVLNISSGVDSTGVHWVSSIGDFGLNVYPTLENFLNNQYLKGGHFNILISTVGVFPNSDNTAYLGAPNNRWKEVYAVNGTIQTSDKNYKVEISDISEAVLRAWGKVKFQQYKFKDAVEKKGSSNARIHIGVIANELAYSVIEAFKSEGLDATKYGLVGFDEWPDLYENKAVEISPAVIEQVKIVDKPEVKDIRIVNDVEEEYVVEPEVFHMEEQEVKPPVFKTERILVKPAGRIYNVRYDECLTLECAYQRAELNKIKAKLGI